MSHTKLAKIVKIDNGSYKSFNAYNGKAFKSNYEPNPKKTSTKVNYVNLDPTDNPDEVCEAYRQVSIAAQERRAARLKIHLEKMAAEREAQAELEKIRSEKRSQAQLLRFNSQPEIIQREKRRKMIADALNSGLVVNALTTKLDVKLLGFDIKALRVGGLDVVTCLARNPDGKGESPGYIYSLDKFKRTDEVIGGELSLFRNRLMELLKDGYLIRKENICPSISTASFKNTLMVFRRSHDMLLCSVKNTVLEKYSRGFVLCNDSGLLKKVADL